jgi:hypothetical protein
LEIRYQLLHRTASAIILAQRFHARHAAMVVHSFSPAAKWIDDYYSFARLLGAAGSLDGVIDIPGHDQPTLSLAWVQDTVPNA